MSFERDNITQVPQTMHLPRPTQPMVATLPINPNAGSPPDTVTPALAGSPTLVPLLGVVDYSEKVFVVFGESTKTHKESLKALGGKFNLRFKPKPGFPGGPGWMYMHKMKPQVFDFVNKVNTGAVATQQNIPLQGPQGGLPTVVVPIKNLKFQSVRWKVFIPRDGMKVTIKADGGQLIGEVLQTETHRNVVDTAYINMGGNTSKLVICNGRWQVWGYMVEHNVFFEDGTKSPATASPTETTATYQDIAGI